MSKMRTEDKEDVQRHQKEEELCKGSSEVPEKGGDGYSGCWGTRIKRIGVNGVLMYQKKKELGQGELRCLEYAQSVLNFLTGLA